MNALRTDSGIDRLLSPRSVAVIGGSTRPEALGNRVLGGIVDGGYGGVISVLGRQPTTIHGIPCVTSFDDLPDEIDLALLAVPAAQLDGVIDSCIAHGVGAAVCYASGFAELGDQGRRLQHQLGERARRGRLRLLGPNCFGVLNAASGFSALLAPMPPTPSPGTEHGPGVAVLTQSGGLGTLVAGGLGSRGVPVTHLVASGNEADVELADLIEHLADDAYVAAFAVYAEQIRHPDRFLRAVRLARAQHKPVVLLHPGRSDRAKAAVQSHTGALATDHAVMVTIVRRAGVVVVDTVEELVDLAQLLLRFPIPPGGGVGVITQSGAVCAILTDAADELGVTLPDPSAELEGGGLEGAGPESAGRGTEPGGPVGNPLDLGTGTIADPMIIGRAVQRMITDPAIGSVLVSNPDARDPLDSIWLDTVLPQLADTSKPVVYVSQNEGDPPPDFRRRLLANRVVFHRSPERAMRMLARAGQAGAQLAVGHRRPDPAATLASPLPPGVQPEWQAKQLLQQLGIAVPAGALAKTADEAVQIAERVGYPVVAKVQSAQLSHKSDVGGVVLSIADAAQLRAAWTRLHSSVTRSSPGVAVDGVLVERMCPPGIELVVGAKRDPQWGPVVLVGLGGVLVEALADLRLLPPDLPEAAIAEEILRLRSARLLRGFRGAPPVDVSAVARVAARVGDLVLAAPEITEIDINPLIVLRDGNGVVALDALVTAADPAR